MDIRVSGKQLKIGKSLINYAKKQLHILNPQHQPILSRSLSPHQFYTADELMKVLNNIFQVG